jgi:16S rRNA (guanine(966)-N(2))-methyltransferase RsmD
MPSGVIRPAMDRMRESVFAMLGSSGSLAGASFLDLFSGSGVIALEAASRGASRIEAVEGDPLKRKTILANAALALEAEPPVKIQCRLMSVELYLRRLAGKTEKFDYIFCDPPFPYKYKNDIIRGIVQTNLLGEAAVLMIHHPRTEDLSFTGLKLVERRLYGRSAVEFLSLE